MFYPDDPGQLEIEVRTHLENADLPDLDFALRVLIVPHAGYVYSGPTAGYGYQLLEATSFDRVLLIGPSHYVPFTGLSLPGVNAMETPLGEVAVDDAGVAELLADPIVHDSAEAHRREHSLEVQLPFLQVIAPGLPVIPVLAGAVDPELTAEAIAPLLDDGTLLLISSDLSHYHGAATARRLDATTAAAIERLDPEALGRESACGRTGIQMALLVAKARGYQVRTLDLRNSADTAGSPDRVVGYGAFALGSTT
jgi:AmmeMemoRadiSam system protein B